MKRFLVAILLGCTVSMSIALVSSAGPIEQQLHEAAAKGDARQITELLRKGARIDSRNVHMQTPLMVVTHGNHVAAAKVLIQAGADVNAKDAIQDSPYLYAGARGHLEILKMTLNHGALLTSTNRYGGTALIPAAERGHVETVRTLIEAGTDIDHVNNLGWTVCVRPSHIDRRRLAWLTVSRCWPASGAAAIRQCNWPAALEVVSAHL